MFSGSRHLFCQCLMHACIQHLFLVPFVTQLTTQFVWPVVLMLGWLCWCWHEAVTDTFWSSLLHTPARCCTSTSPVWSLCMHASWHLHRTFFTYKLYDNWVVLISSSLICSCFTEIQKLLLYCMCELFAHVFAPGTIQVYCSTCRSNASMLWSWCCKVCWTCAVKLGTACNHMSVLWRTVPDWWCLCLQRWLRQVSKGIYHTFRS